MKSLEYIEIDVPFCSLAFGTAPCTASIPATGAIKCFNTIKTCQDRENFDKTTVTLRFAKPTEYLPSDIDAFPSITDISFTPATISLGENLGTRATLSVQFKDHPDSDTAAGLDKYFAERDYNPAKQGTFWGKFRARQPFLQGCEVRLIRGLLGSILSDMETRRFVVESFDAGADGKYTLIAKDVLKLADSDRSQAPEMSPGYLAGAITSGSSSFSLSPTGIGAEYPASGVAAIGGKEIVTFTRSGDTVTLTARGQASTTAQSHNTQDRFQVVLQYSSDDVADIIYDLLVNYADVPASYIDLDSWRAETAAFIGVLYSGYVCEPTGVDKLVSELIQQAGLALWWDDAAEKIRLQVLRGVVTDAAQFTPENTLKGSLATKEQPEKRISQVWVYFGQINPLQNLTNTDNYRSTSIITDEDAEEDYGSAVIKKVFSRWIPALGRTVADRFGAILLSRYRDPPRRLSFDVQRYAGTDVLLGGGYRIQSKFLQDATGLQVDIPVQVTRLNPQPDRFKAEAEEVLYSPPADDVLLRKIVVDFNTYNFNLRAAHDLLYTNPVSGITVECRLVTTAKIGSTSSSIPAFDVGGWPAGVTVKVILEGKVEAAGGYGGGGYRPELGAGQPGGAGGTALYSRYPITLELPSGSKLWGGGGGGGGGGANNLNRYGGGGGGGAGDLPGGGGAGAFGAASSGNDVAGGAGGAGESATYDGSPGGGPGLPGTAGASSIAPGGVGGAAGYQIDGLSYVSVTVNLGDRRGPTTN